MKSGECLHTFQGGIGGSSAGIRINSVHSLPRNVDQFALCNKSSTLFIMNMQGQVRHVVFNVKENIALFTVISCSLSYKYFI